MTTLPEINAGTALLVIDVQKGFMNRHTDHLPAKIESIQSLYPLVIATRFQNPERSAFRTLMGWDRCAPGSIDTELAFAPPENAVIIVKDTYSCITDALINLLEQKNISTLHIAGCDTNMCVTQSATALFETHCYRPLILVRYCASHSGPEYHEWALKLLEKSVGRQQIWTME